MLSFSFALQKKQKVVRKKGSSTTQDEEIGNLFDLKSMQKKKISPELLEHNMTILARLNLEDNSCLQLNIIKALSEQYEFWSEQVQEIILTISDSENRLKAISHLYGKILDKQVRYKLFALLDNEAMSLIQNYIGQAYNFTYFNPGGHYKLKLSNIAERDVALQILHLNFEYLKAVNEGEKIDTSKWGNSSCFRNESLDGIKFQYMPGWNLPRQGVFEFDFVYLMCNPEESEEISSEVYDKVKSFLRGVEAPIVEKIEIFRSIAEYSTFSSK